MDPKPHKSGFVAIIGKPNVGKSTLLNGLIGRKLVITTPKAQTTRHRILGILSGDDFQIVFSDTPGVIKPQYTLHKAMMHAVRHSLEDADLILLLIDPKEKYSEAELLELVGKSMIPTLLVINKTDICSTEEVAEKIAQVSPMLEDLVGVVEISALKKEDAERLMTHILAHLPQGPAYFDKETLSDRPEKFFVAEIIREKLFMNLDEELPYSCSVSILDFEEEKDLTRIHAEIHVERKSQKAMVIGKNAQMIKKIGTEARVDIEQFLDKKVFLDLYVRLAENWKDSDFRMREWGY